ncbi:hypothetical protein CYMTET_13481 [Cymbomonas tetramitiformis]|uniref:EF-hand domain-containing protein n=1 Tax=Cymbomonas tetramitiformis TaxID=36881 RepID=A0AAE0GI28_9CHLO|nr:hypothetical protein CYMTET_13481 [Cymbomonas tetramitiformis]
MDLSEGELREVFEYFDTDNDGVVSTEDFLTALRQPLGSAASESDLERLLEVVDPHNSKRVSFAKFAEGLTLWLRLKSIADGVENFSDKAYAESHARVPPTPESQRTNFLLDRGGREVSDLTGVSPVTCNEYELENMARMLHSRRAEPSLSHPAEPERKDPATEFILSDMHRELEEKLGLRSPDGMPSPQGDALHMPSTRPESPGTEPESEAEFSDAPLADFSRAQPPPAPAREQASPRRGTASGAIMEERTGIFRTEGGIDPVEVTLAGVRICPQALRLGGASTVDEVGPIVRAPSRALKDRAVPKVRAGAASRNQDPHSSYTRDRQVSALSAEVARLQQENASLRKQQAKDRRYADEQTQAMIVRFKEAKKLIAEKDMQLRQFQATVLDEQKKVKHKDARMVMTSEKTGMLEQKLAARDALLARLNERLQEMAADAESIRTLTARAAARVRPLMARVKSFRHDMAQLHTSTLGVRTALSLLELQVAALLEHRAGTPASRTSRASNAKVELAALPHQQQPKQRAEAAARPAPVVPQGQASPPDPPRGEQARALQEEQARALREGAAQPSESQHTSPPGAIWRVMPSHSDSELPFNSASSPPEQREAKGTAWQLRSSRLLGEGLAASPERAAAAHDDAPSSHESMFLVPDVEKHEEACEELLNGLGQLQQELDLVAHSGQPWTSEAAPLEKLPLSVSDQVEPPLPVSDQVELPLPVSAEPLAAIDNSRASRREAHRKFVSEMWRRASEELSGSP